MKSWDELARGIDCPFDAPRPKNSEHWDLIGPLSVSTLYLSSNQTYRGYSLLVFDPRHVIRLDQLTTAESSAYAADLHTANAVLVEVLKPDHMNVELLGNIVSHLHWHLVPRFRDDGRWGGPIWTTAIAEMKQTRLPAAERAELLRRLQEALEARARYSL